MADRRVVGAADHQRAPHHQNIRFTEATLLQPHRRRGVGDAEDEAGQRERQHGPAAGPGQHDQDRQVGQVHQADRDQQGAAADQTRQHRMRGVERARIGVAVETGLGVEQIVHQVIGGVRQQDSDDRESEPAPIQSGLPDRQQRGDQTGEQRHRQHRGAGDDEPSGDGVDRPVRRGIGGAQGVGPGAEARTRLSRVAHGAAT